MVALCLRYHRANRLRVLRVPPAHQQMQNPPFSHRSAAMAKIAAEPLPPNILGKRRKSGIYFAITISRITACASISNCITSIGGRV